MRATGRRSRAASSTVAVPRTLVPIGLERIDVGAPDQRLRGQMEDDLGLRCRDDRREARASSRMSRDDVHAALSAARSGRTGSVARAPAKGRSPRRRGFRATASSQLPLKPVWPVRRTLRPRQNSRFRPTLFHGASDAAHRLRALRSRSVSIGCQKPSWKIGPRARLRRRGARAARAPRRVVELPR